MIPGRVSFWFEPGLALKIVEPAGGGSLRSCHTQTVAGCDNVLTPQLFVTVTAEPYTRPNGAHVPLRSARMCTLVPSLTQSRSELPSPSTFSGWLELQVPNE